MADACKVIDIRKITSVSYKGEYYNKKYDSKLNRNYIEVNGQKLYLDKNDMVSKRQFGQKSEVYAFQSIEEIKGILNYFKENELWQCYLWFILGTNMARRAGDTRNLTWDRFFNEDGKFRTHIKAIKEEKTDKFANPKINKAVRDGIKLYCEKLNIDPMNEYNEYVFLNRTGKFIGKLYTEKAYGQNIKKAALSIGLEYNVNTHSDSKTTRKYIGITKSKVDKYYDDLGNYFNDYIIGDKIYSKSKNSPVLTLHVEDLRQILTETYNSGFYNGRRKKSSPDTHLQAINRAMQKLDEKALGF